MKDPECFGSYEHGQAAIARNCASCLHQSRCAVLMADRSVVVPLLAEATTPDQIMYEMAKTFAERNAVYGDNWKKAGEIFALLHPNGVQLKTPEDHQFFHLWSLMIVKLTRFANSGLTHIDSLHDLSVYGSMCESILRNRKENK